MKETKRNIVVFVFILLNFYVFSQLDTLKLELNWTNSNIKHLYGKVIIRDSLNNLFFGEKFNGESTFQKIMNLKIPVKSNDVNLNIEIKLIDFYPQKICLNALKVKEIKCFLIEIPICELKKIQ